MFEEKFEIFNFVKDPRKTCRPVNFSNKRRNQANSVLKESNKNFQGFENLFEFNGVNATEELYGWYKYGCAGETKCLPVGVLSMSSRQPNGNRFCFSNFGSMDSAETFCMMFNTKKPGSCSHIVSYQTDSGDYRWELLNLHAKVKC